MCSPVLQEALTNSVERFSIIEEDNRAVRALNDEELRLLASQEFGTKIEHNSWNPNEEEALWILAAQHFRGEEGRSVSRQNHPTEPDYLVISKLARATVTSV